MTEPQLYILLHITSLHRVGYVKFEVSDAVDRAIEDMNHSTIGSREVLLSRAEIDLVSVVLEVCLSYACVCVHVLYIYIIYI